MEEMNDVNDFMAKFDSKFEIKWGIAIDPELGDKIKVTILATGFGIENVDGMNSHIKKITQEERELRAEKEEKADRRRENYYGKDSKETKRRLNIYIFRDADLDNDDIISSVESTPTYRRTQREINEIRNQVATEQVKKKEVDDSKIQGTIKFA